MQSSVMHVLHCSQQLLFLYIFPRIGTVHFDYFGHMLVYIVGFRNHQLY